MKKYYKVLSPIEKKEGGTYWLRLGSAFPNQDGSINLYLDALPSNGKLQMRELDEEELRGNKGKSARQDRTNADQNLPF